MKILITGSHGFIGHHLVKKLLSLGHRVFGFDNFSTGKRDRLPADSNLFVLTGDLQSFEDIRIAFFTAIPDMVVHLAASASVPKSVEQPREFVNNNLGGTLNLLEAMRLSESCKKIVFASSSSVYGSLAQLKVKEDYAETATQLSPYALSKKMCENLIKLYSKLYRIRAVGLRFFNVYGKECRGVIGEWLKKDSPKVQYGNTVRDYTHVNDIIEIIRLGTEFLDNEEFSGYEVFNAGKGTGDSLCYLAEKMNVLPTIFPPKGFDVQEISADITKARTLLGYNPDQELNFEGVGK